MNAHKKTKYIWIQNTVNVLDTHRKADQTLFHKIGYLI